MDGIPTRQPCKSCAAKRRAARTLLLVLLWPSIGLHARQIYKSVDAQGQIVYTDHADPSTAQTAVVLPSDAIPPDVMHFCWTNCFTLNLDNGIYRRTDGTEETWTIESFTPDSVILHRHDAPAVWNNNSTDVVYQGQIVDGRLTHATVNGNPVPEINMAWGAALHTLPGSNAERDRRPSASRSFALNVVPRTFVAPVTDIEMTSTAEPPPLPDETQPPATVDGSLWTPGFWAWNSAGYYWVAGIWVAPPRVGLLWTPGYWIYEGGLYRLHAGYWGPQVGYYGGINYGFGYFGAGYAGGRWVGNSLSLNRSVNNLNTSVIQNTYEEPVVRAVNPSKASYNGGPHGTTATPTAQQLSAAAGTHVPPTLHQRQYGERAANMPMIVKTTVAQPTTNRTAPPPRQSPAGIAVRARTPTAPLVINTNAPQPAAPRAERPPRAAHPAHPK
jgi:hypothetical protein